MTPVGYVNLRTFISPADQPLRQAFAEFSAQNVTDVVVDLRYNGGGLVSTAELLANLLSHGREGEVLYRVRRNSNYASQNETVPFGNAAQAIPAARIAFLTTEASASASELVINSLAPYVETAIIGTPTYGKPVGQSGFDLDGCDVRLRLVTFQLVNRDGFGDYFDGLPDAHFPDAFCSAADDLTHAQEDPAEAMLSEALHWIDHGVCRATARLHAEGTLPGTSSGLLPLPQRPAPAQVYQPGFH